MFHETIFQNVLGKNTEGEDSSEPDEMLKKKRNFKKKNTRESNILIVLFDGNFVFPFYPLGTIRNCLKKHV